MVYNRRDQIGHWVKKDQQIYRPCHHACCRGYRAHPSNWPLIPASHALRRAGDEQIMSHYQKVGADTSPQARGVELQLLNEMERRDRAALREREKRREKERHREAVASNRGARRMEVEAERERIRVESETATRGYLVNAKGRARGIDPEEILTGREAVFRRYASDEAKDYFAARPRPTAAYFRGRDTRVAERAGRLAMKHGVYTSYSHGCRCGPCRAAWAAWSRAYRRARAYRTGEKILHGRFTARP
jgi:hypothetical protein